MQWDAIVLAGGRSARLGGAPKAGFVFAGMTLLEHAVSAAQAVDSRRVVVVGELPSAIQAMYPTVLATRENPPFGGPAAALEAGLDALEQAGGASDLVLVLSCDLPLAETAVRVLIDSVDLLQNTDALLALDEDGRQQQLTALYRTSALLGTIRRARSEYGSLTDLPVRALLRRLRMVTLPVPGTCDIDTWEDAERFEIEVPRIGAISTGGGHERSAKR